MRRSCPGADLAPGVSETALERSRQRMDHTTPSRPPTVTQMFGRIAARYDLLNTLMTFGMDAGWRRRAVAAAEPPPNGRALDVGTGTGALALALAAAMPGGRVVGVDFTAPML